MVSSSVIETGVDKLVHLVNKKKKVSVPEAAKILGISKAIIEEWADFLEEEGLISLEYKLATTYLLERKLDKKESQKKAKEFMGKKDAFIRKVESNLATLEKETSGLTDVKEQFDSLKKDLQSDLGHVEEELKELENYENLKKDIDKQMLDQEKEFKQKISELDKDIMSEKKKYQSVMDDVQTERIKIEEERNIALSLEDKERDIKKKLDDFTEYLDDLRKKVNSQDDYIELMEKHLDKYKDMSDTIKKSMEKKRDIILKLEKDSKDHEKNILALQEKVAKKVADKRKKIEETVSEGEKISSNFTRFFEKKSQIDKLLHRVEKDKKDLEHEMRSLIKSAMAFDLHSKSSSVKKHIAELEKKYKELENKKDRFQKEFHRLANFLKGK